MAEDRMAYIGVAPCGCVLSAYVDDPKHKRDTAKFIAQLILDGEAVERVTTAEARHRLKSSKHGVAPPCTYAPAVSTETPGGKP